MTDKKEDGWFGLKEKLFDFMLYILSSTYKCNFLGADNKQ